MTAAVFGSWTGQEPEKPEMVVDETSADRIEARFVEIRQSFIDEFGCMPSCINPDGTPRRKGEP